MCPRSAGNSSFRSRPGYVDVSWTCTAEGDGSACEVAAGNGAIDQTIDVGPRRGRRPRRLRCGRPGEPGSVRIRRDPVAFTGGWPVRAPHRSRPRRAAGRSGSSHREVPVAEAPIEVPCAPGPRRAPGARGESDRAEHAAPARRWSRPRTPGPDPTPGPTPGAGAHPSRVRPGTEPDPGADPGPTDSPATAPPGSPPVPAPPFVPSGGACRSPVPPPRRWPWPEWDRCSSVAGCCGTPAVDG